MAIEALGMDADGVVKILTVGFSGFAFLLSLLAFVMFKGDPPLDKPNGLAAYKLKIMAMTRYLAFTFGLVIVTLVAQYLIQVRENKVTITIKESGLFSELEIKPVELRRRNDLAVKIPHGKDFEDRQFFSVRDDDQIDLSLMSLMQVISAQKTVISKLTNQVGRTSSESGYDSH